MELALCCDVVLQSDRAKFGLPEVSLGLIPGYGELKDLVAALAKNKLSI